MKITTLEKASILSSKLRQDKQLVGLITGSFDVCHLGHLNLFRFAKEHVDILIVGLDHDESIRKTKGQTRPINNHKGRSSFLADLETVDLIFTINFAGIASKRRYLHLTANRFLSADFK